MKAIPLSLFVVVAVGVTAMAQVSASRQPNGAVVNQPPPPSAFDCAADGTVFNSVTGEPIARARVNMIVAGSAYSTTTNGAGAWVLLNVGCAGAQLTVTRNGFLQNVTRSIGPLQLTLVSGSPLHGLKTELMPQSVALGKVLDDQGDPVMGVQITVMRANVQQGKLRFQSGGVGTTNDLGEYRIPNLQRGKYIVCVHANQPGGPLQSSTSTIPADSCYPGPIEGGAASAMELPAGRETKVDFTLNQIMPVHIRGTITGQPEGRNIGVNIVRRDSNGPPGGNFPGQTRGDKFDFRVPPGAYMLTADYFEAGKHLTARVPVDAGSSDVDNVVVHLDSGFTVTGMIRVLSDSQRPVPQFGMTLMPSETGIGSGQFKWATGTMTFSIADVVPGIFRLNAVPPAPFYVKSATLAGQDILNTEVPISQAAGPIEVTLADDGGSVEGDIVDADGKPAAAWVLLLRNEIRVASANAQANGHYKIQNVAPGDYSLSAWDDPTQVQYADPDWMRRNAAAGVSVSVAAGQTAQIKLTEQIVPAL